MKKCTCCKKIKSLKNFHISKGFKDKHNNWCKYCMSIYHKKYRRKKEVQRKERINNKKYFLLHKDIVLERNREWKRNNKEKVREYRRKYCNFKQRTDINFQILHNLRSRILQALNKNWKYGFVIDLLGCSVEFLKKYLESKFKPGMTWSNYGKWHVDHIRPCISFDLRKSKEQKKCFHYTNLQPLWAVENLIKKDTIK